MGYHGVPLYERVSIFTTLTIRVDARPTLEFAFTAMVLDPAVGKSRLELSCSGLNAGLQQGPQPVYEFSEVLCLNVDVAGACDFCHESLTAQ